MIAGADDAFHARLRAHYGLAPSRDSLETRSGLAYCGREFRIYPSMRIADAIRFYAALNAGWDSERLLADLAVANLRPEFEVRRMKRAYQRALVAVLASAAQPNVFVVENGEEFDEPPTAAFLQRAVRRMPLALVTYGPEAAAPQADGALFDEILRPDAFDMEPVQ